MCSLNHTDVVGAVADRQQYRLLVLLYEFYNQSFLQRRYSTCSHRERSAMRASLKRAALRTADNRLEHCQQRRISAKETSFIGEVVIPCTSTPAQGRPARSPSRAHKSNSSRLCTTDGLWSASGACWQQVRRGLTNNQCQLLSITRIPLVLDRE